MKVTVFHRLCTFREFWISIGTFIEVGTGNQVGNDVILTFNVTERHKPVHAVAFSTYNDVEGHFSMLQRFGRRAEAFTPTTYEYDWLWLEVPHRKHITLRVRSCYHAMVALTSASGSIDHMYEVELGSNYNGGITLNLGRAGPHAITISEPGLLDCHEYRGFWISWADYVIEVGQGTFPSRSSSLLTWYEEDHLVDVKAVSVTSRSDMGTDSTANWQFDLTDGKKYFFKILK